MGVELRFSLRVWVSASPWRIFTHQITASGIAPFPGLQHGKCPYSASLSPALAQSTSRMCLGTTRGQCGAMATLRRSSSFSIMESWMIRLFLCCVLYELLTGIPNIDLLTVIFHPLPVICIFPPIVYICWLQTIACSNLALVQLGARYLGCSNPSAASGLRALLGEMPGWAGGVVWVSSLPALE